MKARPGKMGMAFTLIELLVVLAVIVVLAFTMFTSPGPVAREKAYLVSCMANQQQVVMGELMWSTDYGDKFAWQALGTNKAPLINDVAFHFRTLTNYLKDPGVLRCSTDRARARATNGFENLTASNVSYFVNLTDDHSAKGILSGDRHLEVGGKLLKAGLTAISTNEPVKWTRELHANVKKPTGVLAFADGHVQAVASDLALYFQQQGRATNWLVGP